MSASKVSRAIAVVGGLFFLVTGVWAFVAPHSFFNSVATFPPYNRHFLHDLGAFQIGLGAALFAALIWSDALLVALLSTGIAGAIHAAAHFEDSSLGGRKSDPWLLALFAFALLAGALLRSREVSSR
jgi:hypothetical protein